MFQTVSSFSSVSNLFYQIELEINLVKLLTWIISNKEICYIFMDLSLNII